jgi:heme exporter protein A
VPAVTLKVFDLAKTYDRIPIFENLSFEVTTGHVLVVTGRNGSGKSTLLRLLAGLARPTRGSVELHEGDRLLQERERRGITGYLAPDLSPYEELSAEENLYIMGRIRGLNGDPGARASELLDLVGLSRRDVQSATLSTGQRQRLKMGLALLGSPRLLLLDEPGSNLDEEGREALERFIRAARDRGPVVIATNDPEEIRFGEDRLHLERVAVANDGRL